MKARWMLAIGIGLILAAQGAVQAQTVDDRPTRQDSPISQPGREGQTYAAAIESALAQGNALMENGKEEAALERFNAAVTAATREDSDPDLTYALFRLGTAHHRLYNRTGGVEHLKAAIAAWEKERGLYEQKGYPPSFAALAGFSLGQAYLDLARFENVAENSEHALQLLEKSVAQFRTGLASYQRAIRPR